MMKRLPMLYLVAVVATFAFAQESEKIHQPKLTPQTSGTTQLLIAVSPVNSRVVWAAGTGGTYVVTTDGGQHWKAAVVPSAENLQFRDVYGVSDRVAYLMSIPNNTGPTDFRIYKQKTAARTGRSNSPITIRTPSSIASPSGLQTVESPTAIPRMESSPTSAPTMARLGSRSRTTCLQH